MTTAAHTPEFEALLAMLPRWRREMLGELKTVLMVPRTGSPESNALKAAGMAPEPDPSLSVEDAVRVLRAIVASADAGDLRGENRDMVATHARDFLASLGPDPVATIYAGPAYPASVAK